MLRTKLKDLKNGPRLTPILLYVVNTRSYRLLRSIDVLLCSFFFIVYYLFLFCGASLCSLVICWKDDDDYDMMPVGRNMPHRAVHRTSHKLLLKNKK